MKYTGVNVEGFEDRARYAVTYRDTPNAFAFGFEQYVRDLAHDYHIADTDIWDYLAEYDE